MTAQEVGGGLWQDPAEERRQLARQAFMDKWTQRDEPTSNALDEAIAVATQTRVTQQVYDAAVQAYGQYDRHSFGIVAAVEAAFKAAGFQVES